MYLYRMERRDRLLCPGSQTICTKLQQTRQSWAPRILLLYCVSLSKEVNTESSVSYTQICGLKTLCLEYQYRVLAKLSSSLQSQTLCLVQALALRSYNHKAQVSVSLPADVPYSLHLGENLSGGKVPSEKWGSVGGNQPQDLLWTRLSTNLLTHTQVNCTLIS